MTKEFSIKRVLFNVFGGVAAATLIGAGSAAADAPKRCTVNTAMLALSQADNSAVCGCEVVTLGFVRYIQFRDEFTEIVQAAAQQCSSMAVVLTETPVAAIRSNRYIASDPKGAAPGTCSESECDNDFVTDRPERTTRTPDPAPKTPKPERQTFEQGHPQNPDGSTPHGRPS